MAINVIRLELARTAEYPEGSAAHGYEFIVPLDAESHIDVEAWRADKKASTVKRFWGDEDAEEGYLIHTRHRTWAFSYAAGEEDDEPFFRFESHAFREGEYVSLTGHNGEIHPFKVVAVR
ncbi:MAG: hypothetical protein V3U44_08730 [Alphaproteobacteria bacterium]